jgi:hypothetical protein
LEYSYFHYLLLRTLRSIEKWCPEVLEKRDGKLCGLIRRKKERFNLPASYVQSDSTGPVPDRRERGE